MKKHPCELHSCLRHIMRLCRWNGFFPVEGLNNSTPERIRFNLKSIYTAYYVISAMCMIATSCLAFYGVIHYDKNLETIKNFFFVVYGLFIILLLVRLSKKWPDLIKVAMDTERELCGIRKAKNIPTICKVLSYTFLAMVVVEYILRIEFYFRLVNCSEETVLDFNNIEMLFRYRLQYISVYIPYNTWFGLFSEILSIQATFLWSFIDIMVMCFSVYLTSYFRDLGKAIDSRKPKDWARLRMYYSRLVVLLNYVNSQLGCFIFLSAVFNLVFICFQLFSCLHKGYARINFCYSDDAQNIQRNIQIDHLAYYLFSFTYILVRALMMLYLAGDVHRSANSSVLALYEVPTSEYNIEVERFQFQIRYTKLGLSGLFYHIERTLIIRVIGTIITYELVMLQFSYQQDAA